MSLSWISGWKFLDYISLSSPKKRVVANEPNSEEIFISFTAALSKEHRRKHTYRESKIHGHYANMLTVLHKIFQCGTIVLDELPNDDTRDSCWRDRN